MLQVCSGESQFPAIWSEEGKYLASVLGDALVKGLTQVSQERPEDPVEYLANFLRKYGKDDRTGTDSPAFEEDTIAQAAAAATITSMALHQSDLLPELEEQTEEPTSEEPETSDEPTEQTTDEAGNETAAEGPADDEATQGEEETETETETQGEVQAEQNDAANVAEEAPPTDAEEPMEQDEPQEEQRDIEGQGEAMEQQVEPPDEIAKEAEPDQDQPAEELGPENTNQDADANEVSNASENVNGTEDASVPETGDATAAADNIEKSNDTEDAEMLKRLEAEVEEQNAEEQEDDEAIQTQEDPIDEIEGAGQRDDRGQSVLHFAAARPGGSTTLLAFLQNPTVNLAWRDERMKTARDVASSLNRSENLQTIDSYVIGKAVSGDLETLQKLLSDGYDHLVDIEDTNKNNIIELAGKAGQENVVNFLKSVPQFQEKLDKLMDSIRVGDLERVKEFLQDDPALAVAMGKQGRTPLHVAVLCEEYNIVQHIAQNFPPALRRGDNMERTALHYAMGIEKVEKMTRILVRMGAKRVLKDIRGRQPSYYFINRDEIAILQEEEKST